jgi:hypothetical protein
VIVLSRISLLNILVSLYGETIIPSAVYEEVVVRGRSKPESRELETLIREGKARLLAPRHRSLVEALHDPLGLGEAEAIALALESFSVAAL